MEWWFYVRGLGGIWGLKLVSDTGFGEFFVSEYSSVVLLSERFNWPSDILTSKTLGLVFRLGVPQLKEKCYPNFKKFTFLVGNWTRHLLWPRLKFNPDYTQTIYFHLILLNNWLLITWLWIKNGWFSVFMHEIWGKTS